MSEKVILPLHLPINTNNEYISYVHNFYNSYEQVGKKERLKCCNFVVRCFANFVKYLLIHELTNEYKFKKCIDLGSGRGADVCKWKETKYIHSICFFDISEKSMEVTIRRWRNHRTFFYGSFVIGNFCNTLGKTPIPYFRYDRKKKWQSCDYSTKLNNNEFDFINCQVAFHYCFSSPETLENAFQFCSNNLAPGGILLITIPNYNFLKEKTNDFTVNFQNQYIQVTEVNKSTFNANYRFVFGKNLNIVQYTVSKETLLEYASKSKLFLKREGTFLDLLTKEIKVPEHQKTIQSMKLATEYMHFPAFQETMNLYSYYVFSNTLLK